MSLISEQLPNLMNGVSQQAVTMRMASQAEVQTNGLSSLVSGNVKRPPTKFLAKIRSGSAEGSHIHVINRDSDEKYVVFTEDRSVRVFDLEGNEKVVTYPNGTDYLSSSAPALDFRAVTVADYTFFVNRKEIVETLPDRSPTQGTAALLFIKEAAYETNYRVRINKTEVAAYTTVDATSGSAVSIEIIVGQLKTQLQASLSDTEYLVQARGSVIYLERLDGADYQVELLDNNGNVHVDTIRNAVQRFTDLPVLGRRDFTIKVTGDDSSTFDEYYLKFLPDNDGLAFDDGIWEETVAPDVPFKLDPATLPHTLVRMPDGSFEFRQEVWGDRIAGDEESAPFPSFVGRTINDIYFDRLRLCMTSGDNVIMSKRKDFFNFMPETVLQVLDDGRIDVSTTGAKVTNLSHAMPFNGKILLFSDQVQYVIDTDVLLASSPPAVNQLSTYQSQGQCAPVATGRTLFFAVERGDWSGLMEYYVIAESDTTDAADITEHVPRYIPSPITKLAASSTANAVLGLSASKRGSLWVYKHHWQGNSKLQSSWSEWTLPEDAKVQNIDFVEDQCILVVDYPDGVYLESMGLEEGQYDAGEDFVYRLDRRLSEADIPAGVYDEASNKTTLVLPYLPHNSTVSGATRKAGGSNNTPQGQSLQISEGEVVGDTYVFKVQGDFTNTKFFVGIKYSHVYTFSQPVLRTSSGTGGVATALAGRLQIKRWHVHVEDTGYFRAEVLPYGRSAPYVRTFTGSTLGSPNAVLGEVPLRSEQYSFPVNSRAGRVQISLVNDSFLPSAFTAAEWEARYSRNTSRP